MSLNTYLITFVICTHNRSDLTVRLINSIFNPNSSEVQIVIIDDASTNTYDEIKKMANKNPHIVYIKNEVSMHKFRSMYQNRNLYKGKYLALLDDKDILISNWSDYLLPALKKEGVVIISDMLNKNNEVIGFPFKGNTFADFHFIQAKYGDKFLVFPTLLFTNFKINLEKFKSEKITNLDLFMNVIFDLPVIYINPPLVVHEYLPDGITVNNISHKINNPISRREIIKLKMIHKSCFKYKIYKCYEL